MPKADTDFTTPSPGHDRCEDVFCTGVRHAIALRFLGAYIELHDKMAVPNLIGLPNGFDIGELYKKTVEDHLFEQADSARRAEALALFALSIASWNSLADETGGYHPERDRMYATTALASVVEYLSEPAREEYLAAHRRRRARDAA